MSMDSHAKKAIAVADKIVTEAEFALSPLEMTIRSWPAEFRAIMWDAVSDIASRRAFAARNDMEAAE